jgi:hypothetical protein
MFVFKIEGNDGVETDSEPVFSEVSLDLDSVKLDLVRKHGC